MEPANLHHHQHQQYHQLQFQDQLPLIGISPDSSSSSNSCYGVPTTNTTHTWTPCTTILNSPGSSLNSYSGGAIINTTNSSSDPLLLRQQLQSGTNLVSMSTTQDLGFHWANNNINSQLVKQENSLSDSYPRFTQMLKSPSIEERELSDMNARLLLGTLSNTGLQLYPGDNNNLLYSSNSSSTNRGRFSQIYPTINVSNLNINQANSSSLDMNLQPLDLINSARYGGSFSQTYGLANHFQQSTCESPVDSSTSISAFSNGVPEAKRTSNTLEPNKGPQNAPKKSRVDSRASCPPFKVRKEKLGDRIAALQQLVAPFGKTDTASVLMEAIGYIKFLQNQVETLSVPYMKSSRSKASRSLHGGGGEMNNGSEESKRDLRSRGLCLVPLSCLTYVTDGGGGVWPPPNFNGGT
ncbi:transcription factor bHLH110 isoform X1 [Lycium ferocissimum]|uniref:transcription factor bHLH110 isoform X1 n=1 Tax=Lycium ferocissimum TaxID=112874 RepID=UPI0028165F63|nr:transcription factor bHLH110 isoform X1 [Lycium ferocissimum]